MHNVLVSSTAARLLSEPTADPLSALGAGAHALVFRRMLDIVDYGMLLVLPDGHVAFANQVARNDLDATHPLALCDQTLAVRHAHDLVPLRDALCSALHKGLQRLLTLRDERGRSVSVAILPIGDGAGECAGRGNPGTSGAMLMLGKRQVCVDLSAEAFGRHHELTAAEGRVLKQLCCGHRPAEIARQQGVALSTVRTQIACMREKTGAPSIGALVSDLSRLPPLLNRMREAA